MLLSGKNTFILFVRLLMSFNWSCGDENTVMIGTLAVKKLSYKFRDRPIDLVFVLDQSAGTQHGHWHTIVRFVYATLEHFTVNASTTRVAVVSYGSRTSVDLNLLARPAENKCSLMETLERKLVTKSTTSGSAPARDVFKEAHGVLLKSREDAKKVIFWVTGGESNFGTSLIKDLLNIRTLRWSRTWDYAIVGPQLQIFCFGVGDAYLAGLDFVAHLRGTNMYVLSDMEELGEMAHRLHAGQGTETWRPVGESSGVCGVKCDQNAVCVCTSHSAQYVCLCGVGYETRGSSCEPCQRGTFKDQVSPVPCQPCSVGYMTVSTGAVSHTQCICDDLHYMDKTGLCTSRPCASLPSIPHGTQSHVHGEVTDVVTNSGTPCRHTPGDSCLYTCEPGYRLSGLPALVCQPNGTWRGAVPSCEVVDCEELIHHSDSDPHLTAHYLNVSHPTTYGSRVSVGCEDGWRLLGDIERQCDQYGHWSATPSRCIESHCPILGDINGGEFSPVTCHKQKARTGDSCVMTCYPGYDLRGDATLSCTSAGVWSNGAPACLDIEPPRIHCPLDLSIHATSPAGAVIQWNARQAFVTDNSGHFRVRLVGNVTDTRTLVAIGDHQIEYIAMDAAGNTASCVREVIILDNRRMEQCPEETITLSDVIGHGQNVSWTGPVFYHNNVVKATVCSHTNGSFFALGSHSITCHPQDRLGVFCAFKLDIRGKTCPMPRPPLHGTLSCLPDPADYLHVCSVHCGRGYAFHQRPQSQYYCDTNATWINAHGPNVWPDCSRRFRMRRATFHAQIVYNYDHLDCDATKREIQDRFRERMVVLLGRHCSVAACSLDSLTTRCSKNDQHGQQDLDRGGESVIGSGNKRDSELEPSDERSPKGYVVNVSRRRRYDHMNRYHDGKSHSIADTLSLQYPVLQPTVSVETDIVLDASGVTGKRGTTHDVLVHGRDTIEREMLARGWLDLVIGNVTVSVKSTSLTVVQYLCGGGQVLVTEADVSYCLNCPVGMYGKGTAFNNLCDLCPLNEYQDKEASLRCVMCPKGTYTTQEGSYNLSQCHDPCSQGSWSSSGVEPCMPCPRGHYQDLTGQSHCVQCASVTNNAQVEFPQHCGMCSAGSYILQDSSTCVLCHMNTYQPKQNSHSCLPCPSNTGVLERGATDMSQCIDICEADNRCLNNGTCLPNVNSGYQCRCLTGYVGPHCEINVDDCDPNPCLNNGSCQDSVATFTCLCPSQYTGRVCDITMDHCASSPCRHSAWCIDLPHSYECYCRRGYTGRDCDLAVDPCDPDPCHRGYCERTEDAYTCRCESGHAGVNCTLKLDPCAATPCLNGATCRAETALTCDCPPGYTGQLCETYMDYCTSNPCTHGGICKEGVDTYRCRCLPPYHGNNCGYRASSDFDLVFHASTPNDYVLLQDIPDMSGLTVSFWVRTSDRLHYSTPLSYVVRVEGRLEQMLVMTDMSNLQLRVNSARVDTQLNVAIGEWSHVCVTWTMTAGQWVIYINGTARRSGLGLSKNHAIRGGGQLVIGQNIVVSSETFNPRESFVGELSQLNIYSHLLDIHRIHEVANQSECDTSYGDVVSWTDLLDGIHGNLVVREHSGCLDKQQIYPSSPWDPTTNCTDITTNCTDITMNCTDITINCTDITTNCTDITTNCTDITTNCTDITTNCTDITTNCTDITTNCTDITTNCTDITTNPTDITTNCTDITTNCTDPTTNPTDITTNPTDITTNCTDPTTNPTDTTTNPIDITTNPTDITTNCTDITTNCTDITTNCTDITINCTDITTNCTDPTTNCTDITINCTDITINCTDITTNCTDPTTNCTDPTTNCTDITINCTDITINCTDITTNCTDITTNCTDPTTNCTDITINCTDITTNCTDPTTNCTDITTNCTDITTNCTDTISMCPCYQDLLALCCYHESCVLGDDLAPYNDTRLQHRTVRLCHTLRAELNSTNRLLNVSLNDCVMNLSSRAATRRESTHTIWWCGCELSEGTHPTHTHATPGRGRSERCMIRDVRLVCHNTTDNRCLCTVSVHERTRELTSSEHTGESVTIVNQQTTPADHCVGVSCSNTGRCVSLTHGFLCKCPPEYTGVYCQTARHRGSDKFYGRFMLYTADAVLEPTDPRLKPHLTAQIHQLYSSIMSDEKLEVSLTHVRSNRRYITVSYELTLNFYIDSLVVPDYYKMQKVMVDAVAGGHLGLYHTTLKGFKFAGTPLGSKLNVPSREVRLVTIVCGGTLMSIVVAVVVTWVSARRTRTNKTLAPQVSIQLKTQFGVTQDMGRLQPLTVTMDYDESLIDESAYEYIGSSFGTGDLDPVNVGEISNASQMLVTVDVYNGADGGEMISRETNDGYLLAVNDLSRVHEKRKADMCSKNYECTRTADYSIVRQPFIVHGEGRAVMSTLSATDYSYDVVRPVTARPNMTGVINGGAATSDRNDSSMSEIYMEHEGNVGRKWRRKSVENAMYREMVLNTGRVAKGGRRVGDWGDGGVGGGTGVYGTVRTNINRSRSLEKYNRPGQLEDTGDSLTRAEVTGRFGMGRNASSDMNRAGVLIKGVTPGRKTRVWRKPTVLCRVVEMNQRDLPPIPTDDTV